MSSLNNINYNIINLNVVQIFLICRLQLLPTSAADKEINGNMDVLYYSQNGVLISYDDVQSHKRNHIIVEFLRDDKVILKVSLKKERSFLSKDYKETIVTYRGTFRENPKMLEKDCFYSAGEFKNFVVLSTCDGLRGRLVHSGREYKVTPQNGAKHKLEKVRLQSVRHPKNKFHCSMGANSSTDFQSHNPRVDENFQKRFKRDTGKKIYDLTERTHPVIQLCVTTTARFIQELGGLNEARQAVMEIIIATGKLFQSVEIFLSLERMDFWERDIYKVPRGDDVEEFFMLANRIFRNHILPRRNAPVYDVWVLLINRTLGKDGGILGLAPFGLMCNLWHGANYIRYVGAVKPTALVLAHELGHMINLVHVDGTSCEECSLGNCIMSKSYSLFTRDVEWVWDNCSKATMMEQLSKYHCLYNNFQLRLQTCGNGIVEREEECDCGNLPGDVCNKSCCSDTCTLLSNARCASGLCCDIRRCQLLPNGTLCNPKRGECDIDDTCNGILATCPNAIRQDGTMCSNRNYCYNGDCVTHDMNCARIWGNESGSGPRECYDKNKVGDIEGHCYKSPSSVRAVACSDEDKLCGLLQCDVDPSRFPKNNPKYPEFSYIDHFYATMINSNYCSVAVPNSNDHNDAYYASDGTKCGCNKMCFRRKCLDRAWFLKNGHKQALSVSHLDFVLSQNSPKWLLALSIMTTTYHILRIK